MFQSSAAPAEAALQPCVRGPQAPSSTLKHPNPSSTLKHPQAPEILKHPQAPSRNPQAPDTLKHPNTRNPLPICPPLCCCPRCATRAPRCMPSWAQAYPTRPGARAAPLVHRLSPTTRGLGCEGPARMRSAARGARPAAAPAKAVSARQLEGLGVKAQRGCVVLPGGQGQRQRQQKPSRPDNSRDWV